MAMSEVRRPARVLFLSFGNLQRFQFEVTAGRFLQLLNFEFGFAELLLADAGQAGAFLILRKQLLERQFLRLHRFHDFLEFLQGFLEGQSGGACCLGWAAGFGCIRHPQNLRQIRATVQKGNSEDIEAFKDQPREQPRYPSAETAQLASPCVHGASLLLFEFELAGCWSIPSALSGPPHFDAEPGSPSCRNHLYGTLIAHRPLYRRTKPPLRGIFQIAAVPSVEQRSSRLRA
jgi:hypothetical protein